ncbi:unnamed protein product [Leuciscus chuanchicus]
MSKLQLPSHKGGLDVPNIRLYQLACQLRFVADWLKNDPGSIWLDLEASQSLCPLQNLLFVVNPKKLKVLYDSPIVRNTLKAWAQSRKLEGRFNLSSALTPIQNNPDFPPGTDDSGFNLWNSLGIVRKNIEKAQGKQKKAFEAKKRKGVRQCSVKAGDEVLIGEPKKKVKKGNCLQDLHQGPFTLTSLTEKGVASVAMLGKIQKLNVAQLRPYFRPQGHSHESAAEDIGLVDHQYANKGPLWSKRLCPQQEKVLTYVLDRTRPAKEIVVLDGPVCLQREDFWSLGLDEQVESNIGNACFRLVEEAARRHQTLQMVVNITSE